MRSSWVVPLALLLARLPAAAQEDPCAGFGWNVARERALFATTPISTAAGRDAAAAPALQTDQLYQLRLLPQADVTPAHAPARSARADGAYAGLARLQLRQAGAIRVALDQGAWIDIVADGNLLDSSGFQGRAGCSTPHKIVQFTLPAGKPLIVQLSGASSPAVRLTITRAETSP